MYDTQKFELPSNLQGVHVAPRFGPSAIKIVRQLWGPSPLNRCGVDYQRYLYCTRTKPFPSTNSKMTVDTTPRVIICGAGPVGLFVALKLSRAHIPCLVLEKVSALMNGFNATRPLIFSKPLAHVDILHLALQSWIGLESWTTQLPMQQKST